tara:strand:- start:1132 stop:1509 length:378 start_codon:yes stop_codon:yes gene_type:complete
MITHPQSISKCTIFIHTTFINNPYHWNPILAGRAYFCAETTTHSRSDIERRNTKVDEQNGRTTVGKGKSVVKSAKMDGQKGRTTVAKGESAVKAAKVDGQKGETIVASMSDGRKRRKLYSEALRS